MGKWGGGGWGVCEWDVSETVLRKGESGCERVGMGREWSGVQGGEWSVRGKVRCEGRLQFRGREWCGVQVRERERVWCEGERVRCGREAAV